VHDGAGELNGHNAIHGDEMNETNQTRQEVVVVDVRIPFTSMVSLMVKWAIAAVPAVLILFLLAGMLSMLFGGIFHWSMWRGGMTS